MRFGSKQRVGNGGVDYIQEQRSILEQKCITERIHQASWIDYRSNKQYHVELLKQSDGGWAEFHKCLSVQK